MKSKTKEIFEIIGVILIFLVLAGLTIWAILDKNPVGSAVFAFMGGLGIGALAIHFAPKD